MHETRPATMGFNPYVHGARGLFAMMIMAYHVLDSERPTYPWAQEHPWREAALALPFGVELFFAISGFVILGALGRAPGLGSFLRDRVARIGPVLWASVLFMGAVGVVLGRREFGEKTPDELLFGLVASLFALPGVFPIWGFHAAAWSISYEFAFYLLCGGATWLIARWGSGRAALVWVPAALLLANHYPRALPFLAGVLVARGAIERFRPLARWPGVLLIAFMACWSLVAELSPDRQWLHATTLLQWAGDARLPIGLLGLALLILAFQGIVDGAGAFGRFLTMPPMLFLGTISYSLYMWHGPVMGGVRHVVMPRLVEDQDGSLARLLFPIVSLAIVIPVSLISYRVLEGTGSWLVRRALGAAPRRQDAGDRVARRMDGGAPPLQTSPPKA
ncbi:acyltransferase [Roseomonas sp. CAU 1739]|uniref:acyltransferase family protein n=1 Tax=Roseomonas sp. CAU 1739 TaxID=3140364 RepID=UPI00325AB33A